MDDQNSSNQTPNDQQNAAQVPDITSQDQTQAPISPAPQNVQDTQAPSENTINQALQENQTQANNQAQTDTQSAQDINAAAPGNYIENVGGSVLDLLNDINENDDLVQIVSNEMRLDNGKVKSIIESLLNKLNQGQITMEEIALLMAAPVVDETPE